MERSGKGSLRDLGRLLSGTRNIIRGARGLRILEGSATIGRYRQACRLCIGLEDMKKDYKVPQTRDFIWRHDAFREERIRKGEFDVFGRKVVVIEEKGLMLCEYS